MKEQDIRGLWERGRGRETEGKSSICVTEGAIVPRVPRPCHLSSRKATSDGDLFHDGGFVPETEDGCGREGRMKTRGGGGEKLYQTEGTVLNEHSSSDWPVWDTSYLIVCSPSFSLCSKCMRLHFPLLLLPLENTVISVGVVKTSIKIQCVWFPVTVYRARLSCCVERWGANLPMMLWTEASC